MAMEVYTVIVRGERFILSRDQLYFDAPNYFTTLFEGPYLESATGTRQVVLHRDPNLFRIIESYLSGYDIFPLRQDGIPPYMSHDALLKNLLADARFYALDGLIQSLQSPPRHQAGVDGTSTNDPATSRARWRIMKLVSENVIPAKGFVNIR
jgi:hypothetical protein